MGEMTRNMEIIMAMFNSQFKVSGTGSSGTGPSLVSSVYRSSGIGIGSSGTRSSQPAATDGAVVLVLLQELANSLPLLTAS